ncbi:MinD/ParA family ATP-binding protein [Piscinibacter sp.]|uniref:MinD/ParA family ATP-binding protein n=1 Tax=Piscinibacter sp. TaxID=1903157 RepID=UPI002CE5E048|nr:flagellar biosynthesis protein [Albitalea sp.]HUG22555.1 flagellar biosynthesis protein [Albitalea sp.]
MTSPNSRPAPLDQADGLRRLFAHARVRCVPVASNPHVAFGGVMLERLCAAFGEHGKHTLVVDAAERSPAHSEMATLELSECIETLSPQVSYLAARGLPIKFVDTHGSTASFLQAASDAAPFADVVLVHAAATDLCRMFARSEARPLLLADDRPASVTHAYAAMKLLTQRAGLVVHDLMLSAAPSSPRAERIAMQIATCADDFLGAVLRDWVLIDPATDANEAPTPALRRWARETLQPAIGTLPDVAVPVDACGSRAMAAHAH